MPLTCSKGATTGFSVVALNDDGDVVPLPGPVAVASSDPALATFGVNADGTGGVMSGIAKGDCQITATSGALTVTDGASVTGSVVPVALRINPAA